jgi:hypothetical protein
MCGNVHLLWHISELSVQTTIKWKLVLTGLYLARCSLLIIPIPSSKTSTLHYKEHTFLTKYFNISNMRNAYISVSKIIRKISNILCTLAAGCLIRHNCAWLQMSPPVSQWAWYYKHEDKCEKFRSEWDQQVQCFIQSVSFSGMLATLIILLCTSIS